MLRKGAETFVELPPLSCGGIYGAAAIGVDESDSTLGQVLLLGGHHQTNFGISSMRLVDLATGVCTPQAALLHTRSYFAAAGLPDGRVVCAGGLGIQTTAEMWGPPSQGAHQDAAWTWSQLPPMSVGRQGCIGCVLSDGRFAVIGGRNNSGITSSCEMLSFGGDGDWQPLPPMQNSRSHFVHVVVAGCIIVAGGVARGVAGGVAGGGGAPHRRSAEVFDEVLGRWLRLPCDLPHAGGLVYMGSALL